MYIVVDIIGVCKDSGSVIVFNSKTTGTEFKKRELIIMDKSLASITVTLWNNVAESFKSDIGRPVVLFKHVRVGEYGDGKTLTMGIDSAMQINPDLIEATQLRAWYDTEGHTAQIVHLSARGALNSTTQWLTFQEAEERKLGEGTTADYFQLCGVISELRPDNPIYRACNKCNKKVIDLENGMFRCDKCKVVSHNYKNRLMLNVRIYIYILTIELYGILYSYVCIAG